MGNSRTVFVGGRRGNSRRGKNNSLDFGGTTGELWVLVWRGLLGGTVGREGRGSGFFGSL